MIEDVKSCAHCGRDFLPRKYWQIYCSRTCNTAAYYLRKVAQYDPTDPDPTKTTPAQEADRKRRQDLREAIKTHQVVEAFKKLEEADQAPSLEEILNFNFKDPDHDKRGD
jgi:hypothetical protein